MKKIFFFIILLSAFAVQAETVQQMWARGNDAYGKSDYPAAIAAYEGILQAGQQSAELYYNLGNAYYRQNEIGQAIFCYERALRLRPNFRDCRENLNLANSKTEDNIENLPELFIKRWGQAIVNLFTLNGWMVVILILLAIYFGCLLYIRYFADGQPLRIALYGSFVVIFLTIVAFICFFVARSQAKTHNQAIILQPAITVMSSPESTGVEKFILHEGTKVSIQEDLGDWYKIQIADGNTGWIGADEISII